MASPKGQVKPPPETLPGNFDFNGQNPPATLPGNFDFSGQQQNNTPPPLDAPTNPVTIQNLTKWEPLNSRPGIMGHVETALSDLGSGLLGAPLNLVSAVEHPLQTEFNPVDPAIPMVKNLISHPVQTAVQTLGGAGAFEPFDLATEIPTGPELRNLAMGDPNMPALRVMRETPSSTSAARSLEAVQGARPFLQGMKSVEDAQTRIPAAKNEIWSPYTRAIYQYGDQPIKGPDGMTTIRELEEQRQQMSAINRGLKSGDPAALQLAEQKGLNQASALQREEDIQNALDPALEKLGIDPKAIRKSFGQVSAVGNELMGRSTLNERSPRGFGRMMNMRLTNPRTWIGQPAQGLRDLIAGRDWWTTKPSDEYVREAFRFGGPKPNFGEVRPNPFQLPATASVPEGEEPIGRMWPSGVNAEPMITPPPRFFKQLPPIAGEGEPQPMIQAMRREPPSVESQFSRERIVPSRGKRSSEIATNVLPRENRGLTLPSQDLRLLPASASEGEPQPMIQAFERRVHPEEATEPRTRVAPTKFAKPEVIPPRFLTVLPEGGAMVAPRGLLPEPLEVPPPTSTRIYPRGSEFEHVDPAEYYPPGSKFRKGRQ